MGNLLELVNLSVAFAGEEKKLLAVRNLNFSVSAGSITCLVGESGCGKSVACRAILRLVPEYAQLTGAVNFAGRDLLTFPEKQLRQIRGASIGMIFQEPMTSLNPVLTVGEQTAEPLRLHLHMGRKEARARVVELFTQVGIPEAEARLKAYPHQLSGGMRQRVMIAMALACGPALLLADEPTTALDATIQGQILRLLKNESLSRGMAVLLITHDLGVVAETAHTTGVLYGGTLMEWAETHELFQNPLNPYTRGLMASQPGREAIHMTRLPAIAGTVPTLAHMPEGCPFQPRCPDAMPICAEKIPPNNAFGSHRVACWLYN